MGNRNVKNLSYLDRIIKLNEIDEDIKTMKTLKNLNEEDTLIIESHISKLYKERRCVNNNICSLPRDNPGYWIKLDRKYQDNNEEDELYDINEVPERIRDLEDIIEEKNREIIFLKSLLRIN